MRKTLSTVALFFVTCIGAASAHAENNCETLLEWSALTPAEKIELLQSYEEPISSEEKRVEEVENRALKEAIVSTEQEALSNISKDEIADDKSGMPRVASIGRPRLAFVNVFKIEDTVVAVRFYFYQDGGAVEDGKTVSQSHYETKKAAQDAGLDTGADVNWQGQAIYEWDGKKLTPLTFSNSEGRGFTWGGW